MLSAQDTLEYPERLGSTQIRGREAASTFLKGVLFPPFRGPPMMSESDPSSSELLSTCLN
jgi:hypothetical protein